MEEIAISKFKATCLAVLEKVRLTGQPIRVTRHGRAVAEIVPSHEATREKFRLGGMEGKLKVTGDIIAPAAAPDEWEVLRDEITSGHAHLDLERRRTGSPSRKSPKGPRKHR